MASAACRYCGLTDAGVPPPARVCACATHAHPTCVLRRRAAALEAYLASCGRMSREAFQWCETCGCEYTLPPREQQLGRLGPRTAPYRWRLVLCVWLADALALCVCVALLKLLVAMPIRLALARAIADRADADGSGTISLDEAVALAISTGDTEGAAALPKVCIISVQTSGPGNGLPGSQWYALYTLLAQDLPRAHGYRHRLIVVI
jgi:hypothetical protein